MRSSRLLLLATALPALLSACSVEPTGVRARLEGRGALFASPPDLPRFPESRCHEPGHAIGENTGVRRRLPSS